MIPENKWPVLLEHDRALVWLRLLDDLGRAPRTVDAYARGLAEFVSTCDRNGVDPLAATRADIAGYVHELRDRRSRRGGNVVVLDSGSGLANATIQQRLVLVRLFYDYLVVDDHPYGDASPAARSRAGTAVGASATACTHRRRSTPRTEAYTSVRGSNPVGRGRYTPGRGRGGAERGLVPRHRSNVAAPPCW